MKSTEIKFTAIPSTEEVKAERDRLAYLSRYGRVLRSTIYALVVVAAVAVAWLTARVSMVRRIAESGAGLEIFDTTVWDYARKNNITAGDATHVGFNGGAYNYPCQTSGFFEYFEPDGVTDCGR